MKMIKKIGISLFLLFFFYFLFVLRGIYFPLEPKSKKEIIFEIKRGERVIEIASNLKKEKLIFSPISFEIYVFIKGYFKNLQAGKYLISPSMNVPQITKKFVFGETIKEKIRILEGWNKNEIGDYLEKRGILKKEEFLNLVENPEEFSNEFDFLKDKPKDASLEGYLFPDTYEIEKGESGKEIIRKMLKNFKKKIETKVLEFNSSPKEEILRQGKSIFEVVTLASLVEKEVKTFEEKRIVAGILQKRLKNKIPLQVDATITYITGKKTTKISKEETEINSPYNTYKFLGLPKGPISNPGLESILAVLYPIETDFWYYLSTPDGKTIFSKTLKEHNFYKEKFLK